MGLLEVRNLQKYFPISRSKRFLKAVDGISFSIEKGETFGLVGESGCGKSTTGCLLIRLLEPTEGDVFFQGFPLYRLTKKELYHLRPKMQIVFQDPQSSLNPMLKISSIVGRPCKIHNHGRRGDVIKLVSQMLERVGLSSEYTNRYPHELSGGQRQRIAIARALIMNPEFVVLDEPTSALDVSVQAQILNLLKELQKESNLTYLFVSHNLGVVRHMCDKVGVMYLGRIVEIADTQAIFCFPKHPYTKLLLSSILTPDPHCRGRGKDLSGEVPSLQKLPPGCGFHPRCTCIMGDLCRTQRPSLTELKGGHYVACHLQNT